MMRAGTTNEIILSSGEWVMLDIGFSNKKKTCGLIINNDTKEMQFSQAVLEIKEFINNSSAPVNLLIEAPLSVAFDDKGNPKGRRVENQENKTRYWYCGAGCTVMVAAMYLLKSLENCKPKEEVRLFEGFVSFKKNASSHSQDVRLLQTVVAKPDEFKSAIIEPNDLKVIPTDVLQSAFLVAGIDIGVPPVIIKNG